MSSEIAHEDLAGEPGDEGRAKRSSAVLKLRPMSERDLKQVIRVEHAAYEFPWTEGVFRDCLRAGYHCRTVEVDGRIVGHGVMSVVADECHLLNICIHPDVQNHGFGRRLVAHLLGLARRRGAQMALLEVRRSHAVAYHLYTSMGFNEIGVRKGYYPARLGREDALLLACQL